MELLSEVIEKISDNSSSSDISSVITQELTNILDQMMRQTDDIMGSMISSIDGIAWAERLESSLDKHRFAAMSSALLALSDNLSSEAETGTTKNVLIEGNDGKIFVMHAGSNLLLTVFVKSGANLGISLAYAKQATETISALTIE